MMPVADKIRQFLARHPRAAGLPSNQNIFEAGVLTSLLAMQLVLFIEKEFQITVENEDLDFANFATIDAITEFVTRKTA